MPQEIFLHTLVPLPSSAFTGRDRALLYTRGMGLEPVLGVELALRAIRAAGTDASYEMVMEEVFSIAQEGGKPPVITDGAGGQLISAPPMNRRNMTAEPLEAFSLLAALKALVRRLLRPRSDR